MKKPETFKELFKLVNPQDLLEVIDFSGINDHRNVEHSKIRRKLQKKVYDSFNYRTIIWGETVGEVCRQKRLHNTSTKMEGIDYEIIVESLQDFYYWSHQFNHIHAHIFQRVQNALEIPIEEIQKIMEGR